MPYWMCCNFCFLSPGAERLLAVTTCGHIICSVCYQKGNQGNCLICNAKCQVSPVSDKSSSEVKALFSDISAVAATHLKEISKVMTFQARHKKRLLTYYQQTNDKQEEVLIQMKQEMHYITRKLNEQGAYIAKIGNSLQHQSATVSSVSQISHSSLTPHGHKSVLQIPYNSPTSLSRHSSLADMSETMEIDEMGMFRKPGTVPRVSLISTPQDRQMGAILHRSSNQSMLANHSGFTSAVRVHGPVGTPNASYGQSCGWQSPIVRAPSAFRL